MTSVIIFSPTLPGDCIPLANKCNSRIDCEDESDESSCSYLEVNSFTFFLVSNIKINVNVWPLHHFMN